MRCCYDSRMKTFLALAALIAMPAIAVAQTPADNQAVRAVVEQYFKGHATASPDEMRKPFLPSARIEGNRNGVFTSWTVDQYAGNFTGKPAADEASRKRTIDHVSISGTAAMAGATLVHGATTFTDYFVLLKVNNEWKIANKVYASRPTKP